MKVLSLAVKSNGLTGQAFAIGAILYMRGKEEKKFFSRCPIEGPVDPWVKRNILPQMEDLPVTVPSYDEMLKEFLNFFLDNVENADVIYHMGIPTEARVILDLYGKGLLTPWEVECPWIDISGCLLQAGEDPSSVDGYNSRHRIEVPLAEAGGTYNPLYTCRANALCYIHLMHRV